MKNSISALSILLVLSLGLAFGIGSGTPAAATAAAASRSHGTYFFESITASTGEALSGFLTLHRDGTVTWADQSDFGASGFFNSTTHGVWEKSGPDEVTIEGYYYRFDASGTPVVLVRITSVGSLTDGYGVGTVDVFLPDQNPVLEDPWVAGADSIALTTYPLN
jgi:ABC-type glycerol-3-phosphate transport system substrate-binding protein